MMRWNKRLATLLVLVSGLAGCKQQLFMTEADVQHYQEAGLFPEKLESDAHATLYPSHLNTPTPTTILDPDRPARYVTLQECIAIALEQGRVGSQSPLAPGITNDGLISFAGRVPVGDDNVRVLALDPAISGADIEAALSKFDTRWVSSFTWNKNDNAVANFLANFQNGDQANVSSALIKPLPTGGVAGITWSTGYQFLTQAPFQNIVNPAFTPRLQAAIEQPLLQGYGIEINQLTASHPGSLLFNQLGPVGGRVEGILITRLRFDQNRTEFERNINFLLYNLEFAYWNLYGAYYTLYSRETALKQAFEAWKLSKARFESGRISVQDFYQVRAQYEQFRGQRITALGTVLENERQLRGLMGLPAEDGTRLVPADSPTLAPYTPDWSSALQDAMAHRPELTLARQDLKFRQLDLLVAKNQLRPDLRAFATYDINSIGTRLDGPDQDANGQFVNALGVFTNNQFNNWQLGLRLSVPLGTRDAHAQVRVARLNLARSYAVLRDQEGKVELFLADRYRRIFEFHEQIRAQRAQREANAVQLNARFTEFLVGRGTLDILLEAQRNWADSLANEYQAIVNYNNALCAFQFAKGTLIQYDSVTIAEGPLPHSVAVRASDNLRERTVSLVARERAAIGTQVDPGSKLPADPHTGMPTLANCVGPVPDVVVDPMKRPRVPEINEPMPAVGRPGGGMEPRLPVLQAAVQP